MLDHATASALATTATRLLAAVLALLTATSAGAATGMLTQKPLTGGCIGEVGTADCENGVALDGASGVAVSPDGANVYVVSPITDGVAVFDRDAQTGLVGQKAGSSACISESGTGGACVDGRALTDPPSLVVSPDGGNVYVAAGGSDAVAVLTRDRTTGALTQEAGPAGCISETGSGGACIDGAALETPISVAVSPDSRNVYVVAFDSDAVVVFDRDLTTGALTQKPGKAGCVSETGTRGACVDGRALDGVHDVAMSPDGRNVYVASTVADAVAVFDRDLPTGILTQQAGIAGCVSETGDEGACAEGKALSMPRAVAVSPDGSSVYVTSAASSSVAVFDRDRVSGAIVQKSGLAGCVSATGPVGPCNVGRALAEAFDVAVSPDGLSVYVTSVVGDQIAIFDREPGTGELAQKTGPAGCIGERGGSCDTGHGLDDATRIVVSPDGISVLVASFASDSLTVFDRRPLPYDLDDNGEVEPLTDNLLLLRYLFGLRGSILTNGAVDLEGCMRCTAPEIEAFIEAILE